jgi:hypothetical protein
VKRGIIQFVFLKPATAVAVILMVYLGIYVEGELSIYSGYLYIAIIENLSVTISLYMIFMFYHVLQKELKPFSPISKFLCIKAIIAFALWQSIGVAVAQYYHVFRYLKVFPVSHISFPVLFLFCCSVLFSVVCFVVV